MGSFILAEFNIHLHIVCQFDHFVSSFQMDYRCQHKTRSKLKGAERKPLRNKEAKHTDCQACMKAIISRTMMKQKSRFVIINMVQ
jgi:hypothetical protein